MKNEKLHKSVVREIQKEQGFFDGRFAPKVQRNKKKYDRTSSKRLTKKILSHQNY